MTGDDPQQIPPLWVPLPELPWWVRHVHGIEGGDVVRYLVLELRRGPYCRIVTLGHHRRIIQSGEWDKLPQSASVDWNAGYVLFGDPPLHWPIEVLWQEVEELVPLWRSRQWASVRRESVPISPKTAKTSKPKRITPREQLITELILLHDKGIGLWGPVPHKDLQTRVREQLTQKGKTSPFSQSTFDRALIEARAKIACRAPSTSVKFPHEET